MLANDGPNSAFLAAKQKLLTAGRQAISRTDPRWILQWACGYMTIMGDLFSAVEPQARSYEAMAAGAVLLRGQALAFDDAILAALETITVQAPFRHMTTPGGFVMSAAMTNCGAAGWITDRRGYRYVRIDPASGQPWPKLPDCLRDLAVRAAAAAGYRDFMPDACLINCYQPGARLALHQDKNEQDFSNPIVSVSLGLPATFQFGGLARTDRVRKFALRHGDIAVWGGPSRLCYHGVAALKDGQHAKVGRRRINLTLRSAL